MNTGLIHIYYGTGKGKTCSSIGQCIRHAGAGGHILFTQFMKNNNSSERSILKTISNIDVLNIQKSFGFVFEMDEFTKNEAHKFYTEMFSDIISRINRYSYTLLVLDEIFSAIELHMIDESVVIDFLDSKPSNLEIIMTGRNPSDSILEYGDYISCINSIRHPFDKGIEARKGIEY